MGVGFCEQSDPDISAREHEQIGANLRLRFKLSQFAFKQVPDTRWLDAHLSRQSFYR